MPRSAHNAPVQIAYASSTLRPGFLDDLNTLLQTLMAPAAAGDVKAFEQVYKLTARVLLSRVRAIVGESLAEDVLSDVYLQVWRSLATFDIARGDPIAWLFMIARTRALDRLRAEVRSHGGTLFTSAVDDDTDEGHTEGPEQMLASRQSRRSIHHCLEKLNATERTVLGLAYFRDCSDSEIAAHLGMPLGTVKSVIRRSQVKIRKALTAQGVRFGADPTLHNAVAGSLQPAP
jgi:RNA polymerase sigma-70 factor (ECF subfamily)